MTNKRPGWPLRVTYCFGIPFAFAALWLLIGGHREPQSFAGKVVIGSGSLSIALLLYAGPFITFATGLFALVATFRKQVAIYHKLTLWALTFIEGWIWWSILDFFYRQ